MKPEHIFIFTGPSISPEMADQHLQAVYLPPARLGDIYRICKLFEPRAIGIIDGYFNQVPAVWHKEILWAMDQGVLIGGAASMGALRAAELDRWGMRGYGKIYHAYKNAVLPPFNNETFEDDDEVAIIHGPAELGYLAISEAMVNIRFTLARATRHDIIDAPTCTQLTRLSKKLFYAERNYTSLLKIARQQGISHSLIDNLADWLEHHSIDQKRIDAIELLKDIHSRMNDTQYTHSPSCSNFEYTSQWRAAKIEIEQSHHLPSPVLNELRLQGSNYFKTLDLALDASKIVNPAQDDETVALKYSAEDITALHRTPEELNALFSTLWRTRYGILGGKYLTPMQAENILLQQLQSTNELKHLQMRADDKQRKLARHKQYPDSTGLDELEKLQLCDWYFNTQLGVEMPDNIDDFSIDLALTDSNAFYDIILTEYIYLNMED